MNEQEVFEHAYQYAQEAAKNGYPETTQEEAAYYSENVEHVERFEEAYARGYFAGVDAPK